LVLILNATDKSGVVRAASRAVKNSFTRRHSRVAQCTH
jgi:hypothetical protein